MSAPLEIILASTIYACDRNALAFRGLMDGLCPVNVKCEMVINNAVTSHDDYQEEIESFPPNV